MKYRLICLAAFAAGIGGVANAQQVADAPGAAAPATPSVHGTIQTANYEIGIKDSLAIDVFDLPNLSQTVEVDNTGFINLPLIGQVQAVGRTPNQLSQAIAAALSAKYMKDPIVTVSVKDAASKKVTVSGSVVQPGMYEITPQTTLTQAVALAHGPDQVADLHHVAIVRGQGTARTTSVYDLDAIHDGKAADPSVSPDDTVVVDYSGTRKFVRDYGSVISVLGLLHP